METVKFRRLDLKEVDKLEGILDNTFGTKKKEGIAFEFFEEMKGRFCKGKGYSYKNRRGEADFRARLEKDTYDVELDIEVESRAYIDFLNQCRIQVPKVYASLPKPEGYAEAA